MNRTIEIDDKFFMRPWRPGVRCWFQHPGTKTVVHGAVIDVDANAMTAELMRENDPTNDIVTLPFDALFRTKEDCENAANPASKS